jgi:hypothetical protein
MKRGQIKSETEYYLVRNVLYDRTIRLERLLKSANCLKN